MGRALDKITIRGYKSIHEVVDLPLRPLNVLIGANGAGKTNFISVFKLLRQIIKPDLRGFVGRAGGANVLLHYGRKTTEEIFLDLNFGSNCYQCSLIPTAQDSLIFGHESVWYKRNKEELGRGQQETNLYLRVQRDSEAILNDLAQDKPLDSKHEHVIGTIAGWEEYHFHDTSESAGIKQTSDINDNRFLRTDGSNLAAYLYLLNETQRPYYEMIVKTIRLAAPFFEDFSLRPSPFNSQKIQLEWREVRSDAYFNVAALSDGTLRFMCLATLLLQPRLPSMILIDEPELGLHPYAINLLASLLKGAATRTQVIVATQSVNLVNQFQPEDVVVVDRRDGQSVFTRHDQIDLEHWLDEYGMGDLWEKNVLGGRPQ